MTPFRANYRQCAYRTRADRRAIRNETRERHKVSIDYCRVTRYIQHVIKSFRHRGLKALYENGRSAKMPPDHLVRLARILTTLDQAPGPLGMDLPGFRLHPLKGGLKGHFAVSVSGHWRVTFRFENGHAVDVDYTDYH